MKNRENKKRRDPSFPQKSGIPLLVYVKNEEDLVRGQALSEKLQIPLTEKEEEAYAADLMLRLDEDGLSLSDGQLNMRGDLTKMLPRLKQANMEHELLVKAARLKGIDGPKTALDATAGLGEDSLLLAAAGFSVDLYEYDPIIASLLEDALRRAAEIPELAEYAARMHLHEADSIAAMTQLTVSPDVILLDPMFPARQKSALIKKKFQLLHHLEKPCAEEETMLQAAISAAPRKLLIKRPVKGPFLAGKKPDYTLSGKAIRYDCFTFARR